MRSSSFSSSRTCSWCRSDGSSSRSARNVLRVPRNVLMPMRAPVLHRRARSRSTTASFGVVVDAGVRCSLRSCWRRTAFRSRLPFSGMVLGNMLEENFVTSMIKSDGDLMVFFSRPIAGALAFCTFVILLWPIVSWLIRTMQAEARQDATRGMKTYTTRRRVVIGRNVLDLRFPPSSHSC